MIDILTGRCTVHGWLSKLERRRGYCLRCEFPEDFEDDPADEVDDPIQWETSGRRPAPGKPVDDDTSNPGEP